MIPTQGDPQGLGKVVIVEGHLRCQRPGWGPRWWPG